MAAVHSKSAFWRRSGVFDDLTTFDDLEARIAAIPEEKDRGDVFEIFIEGYIATQSITQHRRHWVVGKIPLAIREKFDLPRDATGIDGIYEMRDGSLVAYQVKFRQKEHLTFNEVAPFLGLTGHFSDRVIFTNAAALADKAIKRTRWVSREVFAALSTDAMQSIEAWLKEKPLPVRRAVPDPRHQVQVLRDIEATLASHDRATVVMACGSGKTLVALWAAEQQRPKTVLVLLPSLTLLQQTLQEWSEQTSWGDRFRYLCVCSDETVDLKDDGWATDKSDVGFRVDTDPKVIRAFLEAPTRDVKVVFSTYHSSREVGKAMRALPPLDLAIFDEAHKTTGHSGTAFSFALSDARLPIRKRLFLTATPRHIDIRHRDKEGEFRVQSMDDEAVYGPRAHTLSFGTAVKLGIICPFKVIISLIDKEAVSDFARQHGIVIVKDDEIGARWVANLIAVSQAIRKVEAKKIISFHSRVRLAKEFASSEPRGISSHVDGYEVRHVNGAQVSALRADIIRAFADAPRSILTNARCLTEGVDIPAVDMVAFVDPRQSRIDITQAVGRAMRKPRSGPKKSAGYVVVPVFAGMGKKDTLDAAIKDERFDVVADVLNALQEHDEELKDIIREVREHKGRGDTFNPRRLYEKIEVIGPRVELDILKSSIAIEVAERLGSSWDEWYGLLLRYKAREGHCQVPVRHLEAACKLGQWVSNQRQGRVAIPPERKRRLDEIGFEWNPFESTWEEGFVALKAFKSREGHCRVPQSHIEGTFRLGQWVSVQRLGRIAMTLERKRRLDGIGFSWDPHASDWEDGFAALKAFKAREGHVRVSGGHVEGHFNLGNWVSNQRTASGAMSSERKQRLDEIGFVWNALESAWEEGFAALKAFKSREGHCRVPQKHLEGTFKLGQWVTSKRAARDSVSPEWKRLLNDIGFDWDPHASDWEDGFAALKAFKAREGHCRVPQTYAEGKFQLGRWVSRQRAARAALPSGRKQRLDEIGFVWNALESAWEEGFAALKAFKSREGHCRVPQKHLEGTFRLGQWVSNHRQGRIAISPERRCRLDAIGFEWKAK